MNRSITVVLWIGMLFAASGATCYRQTRVSDPYAPVAFTAPPTLPDIIFAVNSHTDRIRQLHTDSASLTVTGMPALRTTMTLERPNRFRLRAKLISPELDLGSNNEMFWFWAKRSPQPVIFYANHQEFASDPAAGLFPVDPHWLVEAIGLVRLEPDGVHQGPFTRPDGDLEVRSRINRGTDQLTRVLVIDGQYGWIREQHLFDSSGQRLATSRTGAHRYDAAHSVSLPHRIEIEMPAAQLSLRIDVTEYAVNQVFGDPSELWSMPVVEGYTPVNLVRTQRPVARSSRRDGVDFFGPRSGQRGRTALAPSYRGHLPPR